MTPDAAPRGHLHYVELGSPNSERLARFYADIFGMSAVRTTQGWICRGPNRCVVIADGPPRTLLSAGYAMSDAADLDALTARAAAHLVPAGEMGSQLFESGAVALRDPDGNLMLYGIAATTSQALPKDSPPARLQHLVVGSTNAGRLADFYTNVIGLRKSDEVFDDHGGLRTCFLRSDEEHHSFAVFQTSANALDHHCYELPTWNSIRDWFSMIRTKIGSSSRRS
jgi:catechol 2,3-dioxygenase